MHSAIDKRVLIPVVPDAINLSHHDIGSPQTLFKLCPGSGPIPHELLHDYIPVLLRNQMLLFFQEAHVRRKGLLYVGLNRAIILLSLARHIRRRSLSGEGGLDRGSRVLCGHERRLVPIRLLLLLRQLMPVLAGRVEYVFHGDAAGVLLLDVRPAVLHEDQEW